MLLGTEHAVLTTIAIGPLVVWILGGLDSPKDVLVNETLDPT